MSTPFICHVEWATPEPAVLEKFLTQLFNWNFQTFAPNYLMYMPTDGSVSVGIMLSDQTRAGGSPNVSIRVVDMDSVLTKAEELGGKIVVPETPIGGGSFAFVAAPDGNLIGLQKI
jgi:uncharacterized protein